MVLYKVKFNGRASLPEKSAAPIDISPIENPPEEFINYDDHPDPKELARLELVKIRYAKQVEVARLRYLKNREQRLEYQKAYNTKKVIESGGTPGKRGPRPKVPVEPSPDT